MDITQNIKLFKQNKKHKREGLSKKEIHLLVERLREMEPTPKNTRLRAVFCLLAFQGLRQIEIIRLDVKDVDMAHGIVYVRGKGSDDTEAVYLAPETVKSLKEYVRVNNVKSGALFQSMGNRKSERLSTMTIKREFKELFERLEIEKTAHGFRHYYITTLLKHLQVRDVRKFSRHKSLEMLIVYDDEVDLRQKTVEVFACFEGLNVA